MLKNKVILFLLFATSLYSQDVYLKLTTGTTRKMTVAIAKFKIPNSPDGSSLISFTKVTPVLKNIIYNDLNFSLYFTMVDPDTGLSSDDLAGWVNYGVSTLVTGEIIVKEDTVINIQVYDVFTKRKILNKQYDMRLAPGLIVSLTTREVCHRIADDIISALTGAKGINQTKIVFSVKRGKTKEFATIDYDGFGFNQLTRTGALNLFPSWGPNNKSIVFSSYRSDNLYVFSYDIGTGSIIPLSTSAGINSTPVWSPDGKSLALTLTKDGNAEIYVLQDKVLRRITVNGAIDTSPSWSPSGREIAFLSDRSGTPQIYIMESDGTNVRRLTYNGSYNASPVWSPRGDRIAYVSREPNGILQIYTILINGGDDVPLTWRGNNENPSWAPDGLHMCFSSDRNGPQELFIMHWDGSGQTKVANFYDGAFDPAWSSY